MMLDEAGEENKPISRQENFGMLFE